MLLSLVLDWVSIYWFSRAGPAASVRIYYEHIQGGEENKYKWSSIPFGASFFPKELHCVPPQYVHQRLVTLYLTN